MNTLHRAWIQEEAKKPLVQRIQTHSYPSTIGDRVYVTPNGTLIGSARSPKPRADVAPCVSGPHRPPITWAGRVLSIFRSVRAWFVAAAVFGAFVLLSGCVSEGQAALDTASDRTEAIDQARVEAWVTKAKEANPALTEEDLSRVRAAAIYMAGVRR